jgi:Glycosyltransferase
MNDPEGKRLRYRLVRRAYRPFVNHYVALSHHLNDYLERAVGVPRERISQTYNGVDTEHFRPADTRLPIPGCPFGAIDEWLIGWVGRMEGVKDPLNLARAFIRASERSDRLRLVLVGDGALRADLENVFKTAGLLDRVWFAGERKDVADIMRGLDCFALPSLAEGISNTILEAMASRLPVVATRVGGNPELIESGMTGVLVPRASSDALADALLHYFNHRATARRHAKAARQLVENRFSLSRMVHDYSSLYERTLGAAGVPLPSAQALAPR